MTDGMYYVYTTYPSGNYKSFSFSSYQLIPKQKIIWCITSICFWDTKRRLRNGQH